MGGKPRVKASEDEKRALVALSESRDRAEADRARAIILTLSGWTSGRIAQAFGVREDTSALVAERLHARRRVCSEDAHAARRRFGEAALSGAEELLPDDTRSYTEFLTISVVTVKDAQGFSRSALEVGLSYVRAMQKVPMIMSMVLRTVIPKARSRR
jgi:hypothetical protein